MATYLQLTNRVLQALNEVLLTEGTFSTTSDGFANEVKEGINQAIFDVYTEEDVKWPFAWTETTFGTTIGERHYTPPATATSISWGSFRIVGNATTSSIKLQEVDYQVYKNNYESIDEDLTSDEYGTPLIVVRKPDNSIILSTIPDKVYTIQYEYYSMPTALVSVNDSVPIPDQFTQLVVDKALHYAYMFRDNLELANLAQNRYENNVNKVRRILIPQFTRVSLLY